MRKRITEEAGNTDGHVNARSAQLLQRNRLKADNTARCVIPHRMHTNQREHLGDVIARGTHGGSAPYRQANRLRVLAVVGAVAFNQAIGEVDAGFPSQARRHRLGVDRVEVAGSWQHVDQAAQW